MATPLIANRYAVRRTLGTGGQAEVYEVLDTFESDVVALKLLTSLPGSGPWGEAQILRRLGDPHILPIRNADLASGRPYIVTELATHGTLESAVAATGTCGLEVDQVVRLMRQACHGLARAHDLRLVHNDVKPANLFLNAAGECLVGDFGYASLIPPGAALAPAHGATATTAAPEVAGAWPSPGAAPVPAAGYRSDIYSVGATAYWLLAGRPSVDVTALPDAAARMAAAAANVPRRLRDVAPHVPQYVATAIERAMDRNPTNRFASVTELAAALGQRPTVGRRWKRTDEHSGHLACWRGVPESSASTYVLCLTQGAKPSEALVATRHLSSGRSVSGGTRTCPMRSWPQAVRAVMRACS